jgi:hypothetical protein
MHEKRLKGYRTMGYTVSFYDALALKDIDEKSWLSKS